MANTDADTYAYANTYLASTTDSASMSLFNSTYPVVDPKCSYVSCLLCGYNRASPMPDLIYLCEECLDRLYSQRPYVIHNDFYKIFSEVSYRASNMSEAHLYFVFLCDMYRKYHIIDDFKITRNSDNFRIGVEGLHRYEVTEFRIDCSRIRDLSMYSMNPYMALKTLEPEPEPVPEIPKEMYTL